MNQRTANIIMICKGHHSFGEDLVSSEAVAHYMSKVCECPLSTYTDRILRGIVWEAFRDFMSTCDNPVEILLYIKEVKYWCDFTEREGVNDVDAILIAFALCSVRREGSYVNGFTDELIVKAKSLEE